MEKWKIMVVLEDRFENPPRGTKGLHLGISSEKESDELGVEVGSIGRRAVGVVGQEGAVVGREGLYRWKGVVDEYLAKGVYSPHSVLRVTLPFTIRERLHREEGICCGFHSSRLLLVLLELRPEGVPFVGVVLGQGEYDRDSRESLRRETAEVAVANLPERLLYLTAHLPIHLFAEPLLAVSTEMDILDDGKQPREALGGDIVGLLILLGGIAVGHIMGGYIEDGHHEGFLVGGGHSMVGKQLLDDGNIVFYGAAVSTEGSTEEQQRADVMMGGAVVELHIADEVEIVQVLEVSIAFRICG